MSRPIGPAIGIFSPSYKAKFGFEPLKEGKGTAPGCCGAILPLPACVAGENRVYIIGGVNMETTQTMEPGFGFEEFMAGMRELRKSQEETAQQMQKTDRQMQELGQKMKATDKWVGEMNNRFGEIVEYMVRPNLVAKFQELGFAFTRANRTEITDREHSIFTEVDALLENSDTVMAVEIKNKPNIDDIKDHLERMEKLRKHADLHNDQRRYLGAMAGVVFNESDKIYALKQGFYVIEPSGDTFNITEPTGVYQPREW
jgi:uncharacterized coiled-coil DUF342 family protein